MGKLSIIFSQRYWITLALIAILGFHNRIEDYSQWQKHPDVFLVNEQANLLNSDGYYLRLARDIVRDDYHLTDNYRLVGEENTTQRPMPLISQITAFLSQSFSIGLKNVAVWISPFLSG